MTNISGEYAFGNGLFRPDGAESVIQQNMPVKRNPPESNPPELFSLDRRSPFFTLKKSDFNSDTTSLTLRRADRMGMILVNVQ